MKKVRLELPLWSGTGSSPFLSEPVFIKVTDGKAKTFWDRELTRPVSKTKSTVVLEVEVPDELENIRTSRPSNCAAPVDALQMEWVFEQDGIIHGLKKLHVFVPGHDAHEIPIRNERPDFTKWKEHLSSAGEGSLWFFLPWALAVYTTDQETFGILYWDKKLAKNPKLAKVG